MRVWIIRPARRLKTWFAICGRLPTPGGCPWDREQTRESLKKYLIEETYEVVDAIDEHDLAEGVENWAILLLQVLMHAELAREEGAFEIKDVIEAIAETHRHGDASCATMSDAQEVLHRWEEIKRNEKGYEHRTSVLDGRRAEAAAVLIMAMEISKRGCKTGFEWPNLDAVLDKLEEEIAELKHELESGDEKRIFDELGDLLFTVVNIARWAKVQF